MNIKKTIICLAITISVIIFGYIIISSAINDNKPGSNKSTDGKDTSKEEYVYKDNLLELGYTINEISTIESKISSSDVKNYLLNKKYDDLTSYISSPYFNAKNIERYDTYSKKNTTYSKDDVVMYVEIGLDNEFYTNIKTIDNYKETNAIVNKYNKIDESATFDDIVTIPKPYSSDGTRKIRKVIYEDLISMIDNAKKDNINLYVVSGFRTWSQQNSLFTNSEKRNGLDYALKYSAKPGHSEHQLGLAVDLNTADENKHFENSKEYEWLKQNSYKYGFVERYPKGKEFITGYAFEPWHYRYLGVDIATKMVEENITYEEYLVKYNN